MRHCQIFIFISNQPSINPCSFLLVKFSDRDLQIFLRNSKHVISIRRKIKESLNETKCERSAWNLKPSYSQGGKIAVCTKYTKYYFVQICSFSSLDISWVKLTWWFSLLPSDRCFQGCSSIPPPLTDHMNLEQGLSKEQHIKGHPNTTERFQMNLLPQAT